MHYAVHSDRRVNKDVCENEYTSKSFADAFHRTCRTLKSFLHSSAIIYNKVNRLRKDHAAKCPRDDCERERERLQNKLPKEGKIRRGAKSFPSDPLIQSIIPTLI